MKSILCSLCLTLAVLIDVLRSEENFGDQFSCGGSKQSPINLKTLELNTRLYDDLKWSSEYGKIAIKMIATGDGSLTIGSEYEHDAMPKMWGGPLVGKYKLIQFHFHWAQSDIVGSEHLVNGNSYIMEMHAVHIKENLTVEQAGQDLKDGYAVVAYFFDYAIHPNHAIDHLIKSFNKVKLDNKTPVSVAPFAINELIRPFSCNYVTYRGSLTTPPCTENVRWIISSYPNTLSKAQMDKFRDLAAGGGVTVNNYRNLQALNGRKVYYATRSVGSLHDYNDPSDPDDREYAYDDKGSYITDDGGHYYDDHRSHY